MPQKTNAARVLDQMGISYELREYEVDPDDLGSDCLGCEIVGIHFVYAQLIADSHLIQNTGSVGFLGHCRSLRVNGPTAASNLVALAKNHDNTGYYEHATGNSGR